jgi:hypothetical protein
MSILSSHDYLTEQDVYLKRQKESLPDTFMPPEFASPKQPQIRPNEGTALWQRIERYIAYRYTPRQVVWTVRGPGEWVPPLAPVSQVTAEVWDDRAWEPVDLTPWEDGYYLDAETYRVTATVGKNSPVPPAVAEAFNRLFQYAREAREHGRSGSSVSKETGYSDGQTPPKQVTSESASIDRSSKWMAKAMQYSGAADLLRPYRSVR